MNDLSPAARWVTLREAVREARELGAEFIIIGNAVEISSELPASLRARLIPELLWDYTGAGNADAAEIAFLALLAVEAVSIEDEADIAAAIDALTGCDPIALDLEAAPPDYRPNPVRINKDGARSASQPKQEMAGGTCPHRSTIQVLQLYGGPRNGRDRAYVFHGAALNQLLHGDWHDWLARQHLVSHHAGFELAFLGHHANVKPVMPVECSLQASGLIHGPGRKLAETSHYVFGLDPPKRLAVSAWNAPKLSRGQICYAAADPVLTLLCWTDLKDKLRETGRLAAYELQRNAIPVTAGMQIRGLGIDVDEHRRQIDIWSHELAEDRHEYHDLTGEAPPSTPAETRDWLTNVAGHYLGNWPRTPTGLLSTKIDHIKRLTLSGEPTVNPVLGMLAKAKLLSNFGARLHEHIAPSTGRLHASYLVAAAKTGRLSCSDPPLQQLPQAKAPDFKGCIVPAPGYLLVSADYSQIELRALSWLYNNTAMTAVFAEGRDLHRSTAASVLGTPYDKVSDEDRAKAKAINFGSVFGIGPRSLAENAFADYGVDMTIAEAKELLNRFYDTYYPLKPALEEHARMCQRRGYIEIGVGRVILAEWEIETRGHLTYPLCCNAPVQGIAADCMLRALPLADRRLAGFTGGIIASVHDEILLEILEDQAEAAKAILQEAMVEAFNTTFPGAPAGADVVKVKIGRSWKELK